MNEKEIVEKVLNTGGTRKWAIEEAMKLQKNLLIEMLEKYINNRKDFEDMHSQSIVDMFKDLIQKLKEESK